LRKNGQRINFDRALDFNEIIEVEPQSEMAVRRAVCLPSSSVWMVRVRSSGHSGDKAGTPAS
jgi:hypothetical protein